MVDCVGASDIQPLLPRRLTVTCFGVLANISTGHPRLLSELMRSSALRTTALSAPAAEGLAPSGVESTASIRDGTQNECRANGGLRWQIDLIPILDDPKDLWGGALRGRRHLKRVA